MSHGGTASIALPGIEYLNSLKGWVGEGDFSLIRISKVAEVLGNPQNAFRSIHVAGTNGKGSVCSLLASILNFDGFKVGLTTSPHLIDITERISINGDSITLSELSSIAIEVKRASLSIDIELSHFEAITLCAFLNFRAKKVDIACIEVGLGGRLDATNIISNPDICAIVSISDDHNEILGDSVIKIAKEKAGIIKNGCPCIVGYMHDDIYHSIKKIADCVNSQLIREGQDFDCVSMHQNDLTAYYKYSEPENCFSLELKSRLLGQFQSNNIGIAVKAAKLLGVCPQSIAAGVERVIWPCRLEIIKYNNSEFIFDCAHNIDGISSVIKYLDSRHYNNLYAAFGVIKTKSWQKMVSAISPKIKQWFIIEPMSAQALENDQLSNFISNHEGSSVIDFKNDYAGLAKHLLGLPEQSRILISGSIYMIGALRQQLGFKLQPLWNDQFVTEDIGHQALKSVISA